MRGIKTTNAQKPCLKARKLIFFLVISLMALSHSSIFAADLDDYALQVNMTITGTVTSSKTGAAISGASIIEKGTTNGVVSDLNGSYSINVKDNSTLIFSGVGYITREILVTRQNVIDVILEESTVDLDPVVVIGYGGQKSSRITSSITKLNSEDIDKRPNSRVDRAMIGKMAGVQVQEVSGSPGRSFSVKVRGISSITSSNEPLYVVDGFPNTSINNINPNDIASIEVLKDAASAAIYGSRGSNGVVLITTKSGKSGKPVLEFDAYYGIQKRFSKVDVLNRDEYIAFAIEERNNTWALQGGNPSDPNSARSNANYWIDPKWVTDPTSFPNNDWQDLISRNAPVQNYQISASGSNEKVKYYFSGNYFNQQGIILGTDYKMLSFRTNLETKIGERVNIGLNLSAGSNVRDDPNSDANSGPVSRSIRVAPIVGIDQQTQNGGYYPYHAAFYINPRALATEETNKTTNPYIIANIYTTINLAQHLKLRSSFGTNYDNSINERYQPNNINRGVGSKGWYASSHGENYLNENILSYDVEKSKWNLNAIAGFTYQESKFLGADFSKTGFSDDEIRTLNMGTVLSTGTSSASKWSLMSFLSRMSASWGDKYLLSASVRRDGSSRFGSKNRWGWFPAASAGWRISQEKFMKDVDFINELKLRLSYGVTGNNNIGNYASIGSLASTTYVLGVPQQVSAGFGPASFSNNLLGWEKTKTFDGGIDLSILQRRINISLDYYIADVNDLLLNVPIPPISGFANATVNIGSIRNFGTELELNTVNLIGAFKWNSSFNISHNTNKVLSLGANNAPIYGSSSGYIVTVTKVGSPIGSYYMLEQAGVFRDQKDFDDNPHYRIQKVGDIKYKDVNQDGVIDNNDRRIVGNNNPKYFWGFTNSFAFQNFDLSVSMDGQWGNKLLNMAYSQAGQSRGNVYGFWRDRWLSPEKPGNGWVPRAAVTSNLTTPSTFWLRNGTFWRVHTVSLGYNVPQAWLAKSPSSSKFINGLRIYASVDNVYMFDHYYHSPQTGTFSNSNEIPGVDFDATYPLATTYTFGLNLKF